MWLVQAALKNSHAVIVLALFFFVVGMLSMVYIPVDILPAFKSPGVLVLTFYNGMPAAAIDRNITTRMERWCGQATGVIKVESKSMVGVSIVRLYFRLVAVNPDLCRYGRGGLGIVACKHMHLNALSVQFFDGFARGRFQLVGDGDEPGMSPVDGDSDYGFGLGREDFIGKLKLGGNANLLFFEKFQRADDVFVTACGAAYSAAGQGLEVRNLRF